jgi:hypothetical protein
MQHLAQNKRTTPARNSILSFIVPWLEWYDVNAGVLIRKDQET